jgi:adenylate cyclase
VILIRNISPTAWSKTSSPRVLARNSRFAYKGNAVDIKQIGRELGVRYVLEGSVRKSGNRVRINEQLIEAASAAEKIDGALEEVFELQDEVTSRVAGPSNRRSSLPRLAARK